MRCSSPTNSADTEDPWRGIGRQTSTARVRRHSSTSVRSNRGSENQRMQYPIGSLPRHKWFNANGKEFFLPIVFESRDHCHSRSWPYIRSSAQNHDKNHCPSLHCPLFCFFLHYYYYYCIIIKKIK